MPNITDEVIRQALATMLTDYPGGLLLTCEELDSNAGLTIAIQPAEYKGKKAMIFKAEVPRGTKTN